MSTNMHCKLSFARECHGTTITAKRLFGHMRPSVECRKKRTWLIWILGINICIIEHLKKLKIINRLPVGSHITFDSKRFVANIARVRPFPCIVSLKTNNEIRSVYGWIEKKECKIVRIWGLSACMGTLFKLRWK